MEYTEHEHRLVEASAPRVIAGGDVLGAHASTQLEEIESLTHVGRWTWDVATGALPVLAQE